MSLTTLLKEYAKLSSAHFALLSAMIPLMGAIAMGEIKFFRLLLVFIIGLFTHIYVFALNHYNDVELDRLNSELTERPLVKGTISKKHALVYIISMFLVALLLTITYLDIVVLLLFLIGILFATLYDLFNKKIYGGDFILAASVTVGCMFGSSTVSLKFTDLTYIIWILAFIQGLNMNLVGGGLKDAVHDHIKTSKTIAVKFGIKVENRIARNRHTWNNKTCDFGYHPFLSYGTTHNSCNLKCKHCYQNAGRQTADELNVEQKLKIVDELDEAGIVALAFSGGEPLMKKDFFEVARRARERGIFLAMATNGTLITKAMAKKLKEADVGYLEISLDATNPECLTTNSEES